jgi:hypothetical protein
VLAAEARVPLSRADEMLELVDLAGAARRRSGGFSLGMTQRHGHDAAHDGPDSLVVAGSTQEAIGQLAFDHGVVLYEIAPESSNLEDVFFDLTSTPELEVVAS